MRQPPGDRGSVLVLTLAVVTSLGLVAAALLDASRAVLRRGDVAWSSVVAASDAESLAVWVVGVLRAQPSLTCGGLVGLTTPELGNASTVTIQCHGGPPAAWKVTTSATRGARTVRFGFSVSVGSGGQPVVQDRSIVTEPSPARTSAA
jgi:hypothetical protein